MNELRGYNRKSFARKQYKLKGALIQIDERIKGAKVEVEKHSKPHGKLQTKHHELLHTLQQLVTRIDGLKDQINSAVDDNSKHELKKKLDEALTKRSEINKKVLDLGLTDHNAYDTIYAELDRESNLKFWQDKLKTAETEKEIVQSKLSSL